MGAPASPVLILVWLTVLTVVQFGVCAVLWRLQARRLRRDRDREFRLQVLIDALRAERKAARRNAMIGSAPTGRSQAEQRTLH